MKQKVRQKTAAVSPKRMSQYRKLIHVNVIANASTIDSLREEITKVVLKWLKARIGGNKGNKINQFVNVSIVNGSPGGDPPENPTTVNIITMVVNCQNTNNESG